MSNSIAPGSSADVNVKVTALTNNPNVPVTYKTIILKKNLVNGVNTLTQEMMSNENIKYVIKYDYVLDNNITVPKNCILEFDGGSLNNGTLNGQSTCIVSNKIKIFEKIKIGGTWNITDIFAEWFGDIEDTNVLKELFNLSSDTIYNNIYLPSNFTCKVESYADEEIRVGVIKIKSNTTFYFDGTIELNTNDRWGYTIVMVWEKENITIKGSGKIIGDRATHEYYTESHTTNEEGYGLALCRSSNVLVDGITISDCIGDGLFIDNYAGNTTKNNYLVKNIICYNCRRQGISIIRGTDIVIDNATIHDIGCDYYADGVLKDSGTSPKYGIDIEPESNQEASSITIKNSNIYNIARGGIELIGINNRGIIDNITIENVSVRNIGIDPVSDPTYPIAAFYSRNASNVFITKFVSPGVKRSILLKDTFNFKASNSVFTAIENGYGLVVRTSENVNFQNCDIKTSGALNNVVFDNCRFNDSERFLSPASNEVTSNVIVRNSIFEECAFTGTYQDVVFENCIMNLLNDQYGYIYIFNGDFKNSIKFINNFIHSCKNGIRFTTKSQGKATFINNIIYLDITTSCISLASQAQDNAKAIAINNVFNKTTFISGFKNENKIEEGTIQDIL